jgi:hypothetical protein
MDNVLPPKPVTISYTRIISCIHAEDFLPYLCAISVSKLLDRSIGYY